LRARQTQSEDLSDASFFGKLLVLPGNVRLDWKVIERYKYSSLFGLVYCNQEKKFNNIDTSWQSFKIFVRAKLECLYLASSFESSVMIVCKVFKVLHSKLGFGIKVKH